MVIRLPELRGTIVYAKLSALNNLKPRSYYKADFEHLLKLESGILHSRKEAAWKAQNALHLLHTTT